jgi:hypothetical protein
MDPKSRRQAAILAGLVAVLAVVVLYNRDAGPGAATSPADAGRARRPQPAAGVEPAVDVVRLDALTRDRPAPEGTLRNLFRFGQAPAPPPPPASTASRPPAAGPPVVPGPAGPEGPAPPPPITLKFIGLVEQAPSRLKLAVLSDGRSVFYGSEGDTIEGRYRIERIGPESIEMAYLDGRGRQTLRLSGS